MPAPLVSITQQWNKALSIFQGASNLGEQKLSNGTLLIGRVLHVAPQAWLHQIFAPLDEAGIQELEKEIGRELPTVFTGFLKIANGLSIFSGSLYLYGLRKNYARTGDASRQPFSMLDINRANKPEDAQPSQVFIGGYGSDGSHLFLDEATGKVYCSAKGTANSYYEWESFDKMLTSETFRIASLFDKEGKKINPTLPTTPR